MKLRDYQQESIDALYDYFAQGQQDGHPILVLPTAAGKSVIAGAFIRGVLQQWPGQRVLLLTHVKELIAQNHEKLMTLWPDAPAGIYSAGLKRRDTDNSILFAGIQSVHRRAVEIGHIDLIIIDECHLVPKSGMGMYRRFLDSMTVINPKLRVIGLTATPYRLNSGLLVDGDDRLFTDIAFDVGVTRLVNDGYLSPLVPKKMANEIDLAGIHTRAGEFKSDELATLFNDDDLARRALIEIMYYGIHRKSWLVFCSGVAHAHRMAEILQDQGITTATITGATPADERDKILADFKAGHIRCLTNCDVLTTGFDAPATDMLVFLRPTQSPGLYVQMCGRGMRLADGKKDCLVLDFGGNTERHGPINAIKPTGKKGKGKGGDAPTRVCPKCDTIMAVAATQCPDCGYVFQRKVKHESTASNLALLDLTPGKPKIEWHDVNAMYLVRHKKQGKPDSVRVTYVTKTGERFTTWVCPEHGGYAEKKAIQWQKLHLPWCPEPLCVDEILYLHNDKYFTSIPNAICVKHDSKYPSIINYDFETRRLTGSYGNDE